MHVIWSHDSLDLTFQASQQLAAASFHGGCAVPSGFMKSLQHPRPNAWVIQRQVGEPLQGEGLDNGAAILQITVQQRCRKTPFSGG